jgi:hypothetical protein
LSNSPVSRHFCGDVQKWTEHMIRMLVREGTEG